MKRLSRRSTAEADRSPQDSAPPIAQAAAVTLASGKSATQEANAAATAAADTALQREKEISFYQAVVNGWIGTKMEHDKSLLTMSLAGIGLIVSLLTAVGMPSLFVLVNYIVAALAFSGVLGFCLAIFRYNGDFLTALASGGGNEGDKHIRRLDTIALCLFGIGVVCSLFAGGGAALYKYAHRNDSISGGVIPSVQGEPSKGSAGVPATSHTPAPSGTTLKDGAGSVGASPSPIAPPGNPSIVRRNEVGPDRSSVPQQHDKTSGSLATPLTARDLTKKPN